MVACCRMLMEFLLALSLLRLYESFSIERNTRPAMLTSFNLDDCQCGYVSRRQIFLHFGAMAAAFLTTGASPSRADVSDGNVLPQGAQQFARVVKLKKDLKDVTKRLATATEGEIDKNEWDNISKFQRRVYSIAENDMKTVAKAIFNPVNQKQALNDIEEIKKYAQAGDVSASKEDSSRLASIAVKISELLDDFLLSLSDVPDEI